MKHIIAIGHTASGNLGCGAVGKLNESDCTREVGPLVAKYIINGGHESMVLQIDKSNSYTYEDCYVRADQANKLNGDTYTEIHFNSGGAGATGVEVLLNSENSNMRSYAERVCAKLSKTLGIPNRGVKVQSLIVLKRTNMLAMLVECCFVNPPDAEKYNADIIARCIASGILNATVTTIPKLGWNKSTSGKWWYCYDLTNNYFYSSCWKLIDGYWYLFDSDGWCQTGWVCYQANATKQDVWYYLDPTSCRMIVGWGKIGMDWFYFNKNGEMVTGWIVDNYKDYYLYSTGQMAHDCDLYGYRFDSNGVATKI